jgi:hypothetical protein
MMDRTADMGSYAEGEFDTPCHYRKRKLIFEHRLRVQQLADIYLKESGG